MALRELFRRFKVSRASTATDEQVLRLERELREARLEVAERDRLVERLRADLVRSLDSAEEQAQLRERAALERLAAAISTPVVQLAVQARLHSSGTAKVQAGDVLDVAARLLRALRNEGVEQVGVVGESEPYDPDRHDALSTSQAPRSGQLVAVRMAGLSCHGKVVRKAGVEIDETEGS
jgi:molecular chaperone GrpE (heat shock protein)